jgi:hypothetical protein
MSLTTLNSGVTSPKTGLTFLSTGLYLPKTACVSSLTKLLTSWPLWSLLRICLGFYPWGSVGFVKCSAQGVRDMRN